MLSRARRVEAEQGVKRFDWPQATGAAPVIGSNRARASLETDVATGVTTPTQLSTETAERDAFAAGYGHGEKAGFEAGAQRAEAMLRRLATTIEELTSVRRTIVASTERDMVQLSLAIARRIVQREVTIDHDLVLTIARVALERLGGSATATIRLNPNDYAAVNARGDEWAGRVTIVPDDSVGRGGCKVESDVGFIDATVDAQFNQIANELLGTGQVHASPHADPSADRLL
jgi:flagellar assembly protein FliH